jgi:hypothetical protein
MAQKTIFDPVFDTSFESNVLKTFAHEKKMIDKFKVDQDKEINKMLDAVRAACIQSKQSKAEFTKGNAATNAVLSQVNGLFMRLAGKRRNELGEWTKVDTKNKPLPEFVSESSARSYCSAFWIAFEKGIPFQRDLNNKKSTGHKDSETEEKKPNEAKSKVITLVEAQRSFSVALAQLRAVNQADLAGELLDVMIARFEDFKESTTK